MPSKCSQEARWKQALLQSGWFPLAFQVVFFAVFVAVILGGWGVDSADPKFLKVLRNTNLANLAVWSYWWPLMIVSIVLFGRIWCMVCPMEPITSWSARLGLRLTAPRWLGSGWAATGLFFVILFVGIHCFAIHRSPHRMALYMTSLLALAVVVGLIFEKRTFCTYVCPIIPLLWLYSKLAAIEWKVVDKSVCEGCRTKDCIASSNLYNWQGRSCGNSIYPPKIEQNGDCILCTQCAKVCPNDNVTLKRRRPFRDVFHPATLSPALAWFTLVVSGFVVYEILTEWPATKSLLLWLPDQIKSSLGINAFWYAGFVHATVIFLCLPLIIWLAAWAVDRASGQRQSFGAYLNRFVIFWIPVMAAGHLSKATLKASSRLAYFPHIPADPEGVETASAIVDGRITLQHPWIFTATWPVTLLLVVFMLTGLAVSALALRRVARRDGGLPWGTAFATCVYWLILAGTIFAWRVL